MIAPLLSFLPEGVNRRPVAEAVINFLNSGSNGNWRLVVLFMIFILDSPRYGFILFWKDSRQAYSLIKTIILLKFMRGSHIRAAVKKPVNKPDWELKGRTQ
jgi:hypothetical protein